MIQDIVPHIFKNEFTWREPKTQDSILIFNGDEIFMESKDDILEFPKYNDIFNKVTNVKNELTYLFSIDDQSFYLLNSNTITISNKFVRHSTQVFRELMPMWKGFAGITGSQLKRFYENNKYCGKCGSLMIHSKNERSLYCESCKNIKYPTISPAVIVGIIDGDKLLMTKYSGGSYRKYALIAGFMEIGETLEETVKREVMEEVGLKVKNIRYYKNQPWAFSDSLLVGFFADLEGDSKITLQETELSEATWFHREELPMNNSTISLTSDMIEAFRNGVTSHTSY